ncbi:PREDICTED: mid1-interacting protein 1-B-like [Thamnophis sirtalis]|uniref:Mid1-interacting protein 1-B-like n=1 Tax=Thamnophis sirtalis TaxID=35019 RepID=A0A6I9YCV8_9SAUR|nr:PREDICTED: mid1-interacting protein 1-B-like [Thamnophis sirtalis]
MPADFQLPEMLSPAAMEKYVSAIQKMEQTVMFPSLLRGVSLEDLEEAFGADSDDKDLFEHFVLLKSGKGMLEGGRFLPARREKLPGVPPVEENVEKESLEDVFYYHLSSLCRVLHHLTQRAQAVTAKYNEIMERINHS